MPSRQRVSVQGRGAELFFGDLPEESTPVADDRNDDLVAAQPVEEILEPEALDSMQASKQPVEIPPDPDHTELISVAILDAVWSAIAEQATVTNAFRYTKAELDQLNDAIYELSKLHDTKVTKQEVARLGLAIVLTDYQIRGRDSLLSEFIARRRDTGR